MISAPVYCRKFIGRREHLEALRARYIGAASGQGSAVLIAGEPGIGKTRLVTEFCAAIAAEGATPALAQCLPYAQSPFAPVVSALRLLLADNASATRGLHRSQLSLLHRLLPEIEAPERPTTDTDKPALLEALAQVLHEVAARRVCVIVLDDIHWADTATLDFLHFITERASALRMLLVATYRPEDVHANAALRASISRLTRVPSLWRISLEGLNEPEMRAFMQHAMEGRTALSPLMLEKIKNEAEGNPLSAEELLKSAVDEGGRAAGRLPLSLTDAVVERLDRFDEHDRHVLVSASALGRRFTPEFLAEVLERPIAEIIAVLKKAVELQILVEQADEAVAYAFRHALTRDAIHEELLAVEARPLHAKIATALELDEHREARIPELAYHAWEARDLRRAAEYNELAGDAAIIICGYHEAAGAYERALDAARGLSLPTLGLERKLAAALFETGDGVRALEMFRAARNAYEVSGDRDAAAQVCRNLVDVYYHLGNARGMLDAAQHGVALTADRPQSALYFQASVDLALAYNIALNPSESLAALQRVEPLADAQAVKDRSVFYIRNVGVAGQLDDPLRLKWAMERAIDVARTDPQALLRVYSNCANNCLAVGLEDEGLHCVSEALQLLRSQQIRGRLALSVLRTASMTYLFRGRFDLARAPVVQAMLHPMEGMESLWVRCAAVFLGVLTEDDDLLAQAGRKSFADDVRTAALGGRGIDAAPQAVDLLVYENKLEQARRFIQELVCSAPEFFSADGSAEFCVTVARYGTTEDIGRARDLVHSILPESRRRLERAHSALFEGFAALREENASAVKQHAGTAEALFAELRLPYFRAQALELLGNASEALRVYREMGDIRDAHRIEAQLAPATRRGRGKDELTPREREVAQLVSEGKSNAAIAEQLIISERTVEHHVAAIFDKLGVTSRAEVAVYVTRREPAKR